MRVRNLLKVLLITIAGLLVLTFIFISPIVKYVVEKNSEEWTGRKIKMESLWLNIFTGTVHFEKLQMFERKSDKIFVSIGDFYCNLELLKLIGGTVKLIPIKISNPVVTINQRGEKFNFDDLLLRFSDTTETKEATEPAKYFIENFSVVGGQIHYSNTLPASAVSIVELKISSKPIAHTDSTFDIKSEFGFKTGGTIHSDFHFNKNLLTYQTSVKCNKVNFNFLIDYVKDYLKVKSLDGLLSSDLVIAGNMNKPSDIALKGTVEANDFAVIDTTGDKLMSFASYKVSIDSLDTKASIYKFNSVAIDQPFVKFAMYTDGYNIDRLMTAQAKDTTSAPIEDYSNIFKMLADYVKEIAKEYLFKDYYFKELSVTKGKLIFTDYTLEDKFLYVLDSFNLKSENINSTSDRILFALDSKLNKSGIMTASLSINPDGFDDMDIYYSVTDLLVSDINPYSKYYVAAQFVDGVIFYENKSAILDNKLKSINHLVIKQIKVGRKPRSKSLYELPVKLAVIILRDPKGNIDLEIPVEGDLNDPNYKIGKVVWQVLKNLVIKAATAPYNLMAAAFGGKEEDYKEIQFQYLQREVSEEQYRILNNLVKVLNEKPELGLELVRANNRQDEIENLALFLAKKEYLGLTGDSLNKSEVEKLDKLSNKDSLFNQWARSKVPENTALVSIQDVCVKYLGKEKLATEVDTIIEIRNSRLKNYFVTKNIQPDRILLSKVKEENELEREIVPRYLMNFFPYEGTTQAMQNADSISVDQ